MTTIREIFEDQGNDYILDDRSVENTKVYELVKQLLNKFDGILPKLLEEETQTNNSIYNLIQYKTLNEVLSNDFLNYYWLYDTCHWITFGVHSGYFWEIVECKNLPCSKVLQLPCHKVGEKEYLEYVEKLPTPLSEDDLRCVYKNLTYLKDEELEFSDPEKLGFKGWKYRGIEFYGLPSSERGCAIVDEETLIVTGTVDIRRPVTMAIKEVFEGILYETHGDEEDDYDSWPDSDVSALIRCLHELHKIGLTTSYIKVFDTIKDYPIENNYQLIKLRELIKKLMVN
jgi:hypothetical protein